MPKGSEVITYPAQTWTFGQPAENKDVRAAADKVTETGKR